MKKTVEQIRAELVDFMDSTEITQKKVADESGLSQTVVSQFISNTYSGDNSKIANTLMKFLRLYKDRLNVKEESCFYADLSNTKTVMGLAAYAHKHCEMALICGDSGAGKTTALKHYADNSAGVIFVTANSAIRTGRLILQQIAETMGKNCIGCNFKQIMDKLINALNGTKRLIIIDEADRLSLNALQAVRDLNDIAKVGIVLAGNNKLRMQMFQGVKGGEFDQIRTRTLFKPAIYNKYTIDEIHGIFPDVNDDAAHYLFMKANKFSLREAVKLYNYGMELSQMQKKPLSGKFLKGLEEDF